MRSRALSGLFVALVLTLLLPVGADAQIQASERGVTAQTIDGTTITIEYSRPQVRGRVLFGGIVPWNVVWTPGANWATTLETSADLRVAGVELPAGKYSVWAIPRPDRFTLTFNPEDRIFHFMKPDSSAEQIHVSVEPEEGPHVEMLTWSFPAVTGDAATLALQWGTTRVPLQILVPPSRPVVMDAEERATYLGAYEVNIAEGIGWPTTGRLEIGEVDGRIRGSFPFSMHPGDELVFDMVPAGTHRFNPGLIHDGTLFNIEMGVVFEFSVSDGVRAEAVTMRSANGFFLGEGSRIR